MNLSCLSGKERHSSNWGEFFVFGLQNLMAATDDPRNRKNSHYEFQYREGIVPVGTVFNIHIAEGNKYGPSDKAIHICKVTDGPTMRIEQKYTGCFMEGSFEVICEVVGSKLKADRLTAWWLSKPKETDAEQWALHCKKHIEVRGLVNIPPLVQENQHEQKEV